MKEFSGIVVSNKSEKTVVVRVQRVVTHPIYKKRITLSQRIKAHDTVGSKLGDTVRIVETRPISKDKHFIVKEVLGKK